jgi:hypothetical protein
VFLSTFSSGLEGFFGALVFVAVLAVGMLRVDAAIAKPPSTQPSRPRPNGTDEKGDPIMCDPDGRPWR